LQRGTYTSHGSIKRGNRKSEILLREAEYAATMASLADPSYEYPKKVSRQFPGELTISASTQHGKMCCCVSSMTFFQEVVSPWCARLRTIDSTH